MSFVEFLAIGQLSRSISQRLHTLERHLFLPKVGRGTMHGTIRSNLIYKTVFPHHRWDRSKSGWETVPSGTTKSPPPVRSFREQLFG